MAVGGSAVHSGEGEAESQLLEDELHDAECTLLGEVQQIERLAQENNSKVCVGAVQACILYYVSFNLKM